MKKYYCWRCKCEIPMLDENEWKLIEPYLAKHIKNIKEIREKYSCDITTANKIAGNEAADIYYKFTGYKETNINAIWHHRLSIYGPECPKCGHLFRKPTASICTNCGFNKIDIDNK